MEINDFFSNKQYGLISEGSTTLQSVNVLDKWIEALYTGYQVDCVYKDYANTFDTVPYRCLIMKLHACGMKEEIVTRIKNFLSDTIQQVMVHGSESSWKPVTSRILQGSKLDP